MKKNYQIYYIANLAYLQKINGLAIEHKDVSIRVLNCLVASMNSINATKIPINVLSRNMFSGTNGLKTLSRQSISDAIKYLDCLGILQVRGRKRGKVIIINPDLIQTLPIHSSLNEYIRKKINLPSSRDLTKKNDPYIYASFINIHDYRNNIDLHNALNKKPLNRKKIAKELYKRAYKKALWRKKHKQSNQHNINSTHKNHNKGVR